ncbi:hypothetical protein HELRODRAFT_177135 [Helobdella robusta]|uniref:Uncharacterized protein n=1 Tax=Helobdella robusta TaxID=6412 RepID=T1FB95_HELRO|nr:hypothetical protein HELRODRAFT_177135 [Helobdella robusta]ESN98254.1 hypothetical protein HELRODRAFT_177135 [Helobdella robusta]
MMRRLSDSSSSDEDDDYAVNGPFSIPARQLIKLPPPSTEVHRHHPISNILLSNASKAAVEPSSDCNINFQETQSSKNNVSNKVTAQPVSQRHIADNKTIPAATTSSVPPAPTTKLKKKPPSPESLSKITGISVVQTPKIKILKKQQDSSASAKNNQLQEPTSKKFCSEKRAEDLERKYLNSCLQQETPVHITTRNPYDLDEPEEYGVPTSSTDKTSPFGDDLYTPLQRPERPSSHLATSQSSPPSSNPAVPYKQSLAKSVADQWIATLARPNGTSENYKGRSEYDNPNFNPSNYSRGSSNNSWTDNSSRYDRHDKRDWYNNNRRYQNNAYKNRNGYSGPSDCCSAYVQTERESKLDVYTQTTNDLSSQISTDSINRKRKFSLFGNGDVDESEEEEEDGSNNLLASSEVYRSEAADLTSILDSISDPLNSTVILIKIGLLKAQELSAMANENAGGKILTKKYLDTLDFCRQTSKFLFCDLNGDSVSRDILKCIHLKLISYISYNFYLIQKKNTTDAKVVVDHYVPIMLASSKKNKGSCTVPSKLTVALQEYVNGIDRLTKSLSYNEQFDKVIKGNQAVAEFLAPLGFKYLRSDSTVFKLVDKITSALQSFNSTFGFSMP